MYALRMYVCLVLGSQGKETPVNAQVKAKPKPVLLPADAHWQTGATKPVPYDRETRPLAGPLSGAETGNPRRSTTELIAAAQTSNAKLVAQLLEQNIISASIDHRDGDGWSALSHAVGEGHLNVVKLLLEHGASPNVKDKHDLWTPLFHAASSGALDIVSLLLKYKANVRARDVQDWTVVMHAVSTGNLKVVKELLKNDANVDAADPAGWTALMEAAGNGRDDIVQVLVDHGADVAHKDHEGDTARDLAMKQGHSKVVQVIDRAKLDAELRNEPKKSGGGAGSIWDKIDLDGGEFVSDEL